MNNEAISGGPAGLVYGFLMVWAGTAAVFASLSELASMSVSFRTFRAFLSLAGHLQPEVSIIGSTCSHHVLHGKYLATSQVRLPNSRPQSSLAGSDNLQAGSRLGVGRLMLRRSHTFAGRSSKD